jgi:hypothetical protein
VQRCLTAKTTRTQERAEKLAQYITKKWYVGIYGRGNNRCLRISCLGEKEAVELGFLVNLPDCPEGWNTASSLSRKGYQIQELTLPLMEEYRQLKLKQLTQELVNTGKQEEEAAQTAAKIVHEEFIGDYSVWGKECLCISPKGLSDAAKSVSLCKIKKNPDGWHSVNDLYNLGYSTRKVTGTSIRLYQECKIRHYQDLCQRAKRDRAENRVLTLASHITQRWYVGNYSNCGNQTLCISPLGLAEAEQMGYLRKRRVKLGGAEGTPRGAQKVKLA